MKQAWRIRRRNVTASLPHVDGRARETSEVAAAAAAAARERELGAAAAAIEGEGRVRGGEALYMCLLSCLGFACGARCFEMRGG
jgi:hypothetical protein